MTSRSCAVYIWLAATPTLLAVIAATRAAAAAAAAASAFNVNSSEVDQLLQLIASETRVSANPPPANLHANPDNQQQQQQQAGQQLDDESLKLNVVLTAVYMVIFLVGVVGNVCNCLVIADTKNKYMKTATNYYLFSLSISDLLLLIFGLPHDIVNLWHPSPYLFSEFVCVSRGWISEASTYASVLVIVAFTVERYLAICHPLRAHTLSRLSRSIKIIITIWLIASTCALFVVMQYGVIETTQVQPSASSQINSTWPPDGHPTASTLVDALKQEDRQQGHVVVTSVQCTTVGRSEHVFELSVIIFFIIPMAVITLLYLRLGCHLRHKTRAAKRCELNKRAQLMHSFRATTAAAAGSSASLRCSADIQRDAHSEIVGASSSSRNHLNVVACEPSCASLSRDSSAQNAAAAAALCGRLSMSEEVAHKPGEPATPPTLPLPSKHHAHLKHNGHWRSSAAHWLPGKHRTATSNPLEKQQPQSLEASAANAAGHKASIALHATGNSAANAKSAIKMLGKLALYSHNCSSAKSDIEPYISARARTWQDRCLLQPYTKSH